MGEIYNTNNSAWSHLSLTVQTNPSGTEQGQPQEWETSTVLLGLEEEFTPPIFTLPKARRKPLSTASLRHKSVSKTTKVVFFAAYISHLRRRLKTCF